jgi:hypothetical protein
VKRILLTILLLIACAAASAHSRSESYSHWFMSDTTVAGTVTIPLREVMLLYQVLDADRSPRELFQGHFEANTAVRSDGSACTLTASNLLNAASGFVRVELIFDCGAASPATVTFNAMFDIAPAHVHYARLHRDGAQVSEHLITDTARTWPIGAIDGPVSYSFWSFFAVGVEHIAGGIDHIAFLLGLLLIAGAVGRSVIAVTGFTLGHSISLAAAVLGYVSADGQLVEAFIGFTVALVAVEYFALRRLDVGRFAAISLSVAWIAGLVAVLAGFLPVRALAAYAGFGLFAAAYLLAAARAEADGRRRSTLLLFVATCCFGLVHGFGFAGFLMETGLLGTSLFVPLLGFNLGVEAGQLSLVAIAIGVGALLRERVPPVLPQMAAGSLCGIGIFWFVTRSLA